MPAPRQTSSSPQYVYGESMRDLSYLTAHQQPQFPFYEPHRPGGEPNWAVVLPSHDKYTEVLKQLGATELPQGWLLMEQLEPRPQDRRERAKSEKGAWCRRYWMFQFQYPLVKLLLRLAIPHFKDPERCNCAAHKQARTNKPPPRRAKDVVVIYSGDDAGSANGLLYLKESLISRVGAFAAQDLTKGTELGVYSGEMLTDDEVVRERVREYARGEAGSYVFQLPTKKERKWIDATLAKCEVKFLNHSCQPNCIARWDSDRQELVFRTNQAIIRDAELTINYGFIVPDDTPDNERTKCACGSSNCQGFLQVLKKHSHTQPEVLDDDVGSEDVSGEGHSSDSDYVDDEDDDEESISD